jgi:ankyrin repeat protein
VRFGHAEVFYSFIEHGIDTTGQRNLKNGSMLLHLASRWGHVQVTQFLLDHGADTTAQNKYGATPLHLALRAGDFEVARLFVDYGADRADLPVDEQVTTPWPVALHQRDMGLAQLFEHNAIAAT